MIPKIFSFIFRKIIATRCFLSCIGKQQNLARVKQEKLDDITSVQVALDPQNASQSAT